MEQQWAKRRPWEESAKQPNCIIITITIILQCSIQQRLPPLEFLLIFFLSAPILMLNTVTLPLMVCWCWWLCRCRGAGAWFVVSAQYQTLNQHRHHAPTSKAHNNALKADLLFQGAKETLRNDSKKREIRFVSSSIFDRRKTMRTNDANGKINGGFSWMSWRQLSRKLFFCYSWIFSLELTAKWIQLMIVREWWPPHSTRHCQPWSPSSSR